MPSQFERVCGYRHLCGTYTSRWQMTFPASSYQSMGECSNYCSVPVFLVRTRDLGRTCPSGARSTDRLQGSDRMGKTWRITSQYLADSPSTRGKIVAVSHQTQFCSAIVKLMRWLGRISQQQRLGTIYRCRIARSHVAPLADWRRTSGRGEWCLLYGLGCTRAEDVRGY